MASLSILKNSKKISSFKNLRDGMQLDSKLNLLLYKRLIVPYMSIFKFYIINFTFYVVFLSSNLLSLKLIKQSTTGNLSLLY